MCDGAATVLELRDGIFGEICMDSNIWKLDVEMAMMLNFFFHLYEDLRFIRGGGVLSAWV